MLNRRYHDNGRSQERLNRVQQDARARHLVKLQSGIYQTEETPCPICNTFDDELLAAKDRYGIPLSVVICRRCGLIRSNPRMTLQSYADFYKTEYRPLYGGEPGPTVAFFNDQRKRGHRIRRFIEKQTGAGWNNQLVVEVGCGAGGVLQPFAEAGAQVIGCDFDELFIAYGSREHRLDLRQGRLQDLDLPRPPDLIIYSHVLEHILDVRAELQQVRQTLGPDGMLYIEIPSIKDIHRAYRGDFLLLLQNAHTYHFSLRSLTNLLGGAGFRLQRGNEQVQALFTPGPGQPRVNDHLAAMRFLRRAEWLRFINLINPHRLRAAAGRVLRLLGLGRLVSRLLGRPF